MAWGVLARFFSSGNSGVDTCNPQMSCSVGTATSAGAQAPGTPGNANAQSKLLHNGGVGP
jgi:hypothetical protein